MFNSNHAGWGCPGAVATGQYFSIDIDQMVVAIFANNGKWNGPHAINGHLAHSTALHLLDFTEPTSLHQNIARLG